MDQYKLTSIAAATFARYLPIVDLDLGVTPTSPWAKTTEEIAELAKVAAETTDFNEELTALNEAAENGSTDEAFQSRFIALWTACFDQRIRREYSDCRPLEVPEVRRHAENATARALAILKAL